MDSSSSDKGLPDIPSHTCSKEMIREGRGEDIMMSWDEIGCMQRSGIIDIQSHTDRHIHISEMDVEGIKDDLWRSRQVIEDRLNKRCDLLALPWGEYNRGVITIAREAGYRGIVTVERGINLRGDDPYGIKRVVVKRGDIGWFARRLFIYSNTILGEVYTKIRGT